MTGDNSNDFANFVITLHTEKHRKEFSLKFIRAYIQGNTLIILRYASEKSYLSTNVFQLKMIIVSILIQRHSTPKCLDVGRVIFKVNHKTI